MASCPRKPILVKERSMNKVFGLIWCRNLRDIASCPFACVAKTEWESAISAVKKNCLQLDKKKQENPFLFHSVHDYGDDVQRKQRVTSPHCVWALFTNTPSTGSGCVPNFAGGAESLRVVFRAAPGPLQRNLELELRGRREPRATIARPRRFRF